MREGALPSPANQARVMHDILNVARHQGYHANLIEAFDQPWKRRLEGTVGGHWGLLDGAQRTPKFAWGRAVSNHSGWRLQAAEGVALAVLVFAAAFCARRGTLRPWAWAGVAVMALGGGILVGWAIENVPLESLTVGDWLRSLTMVALATVAPMVGAGALARGSNVPSFARVLGPAAQRPKGALNVALGVALIVLGVLAVQVALGLVFDPRYKDFPFAPLTAAALPYAVLAIAGRGGQSGRRGIVETLFAALLAACAIYVVLNESFANWQALWLAAVFVALAVSLWRVRDAPG